MSKLAIPLTLAAIAILVVPSLAAPVIPDYTFKLVDGKPGVIAGYNLAYSNNLALTNPNPVDTGAGAGHQYLAVYGQPSTYSASIRFYSRNLVTPYDDYQGQNALVEVINAGNNLNPKDDGRKASVEGATVVRVFPPTGLMNLDDAWVFPTGGSSGAYQEWGPRDAVSGSATYNQFLVYPDGSTAADGLGAMITSSGNDTWGSSGYNKKGGLYLKTTDPGTVGEKIYVLDWGNFYTSPNQWGAGFAVLGPRTDGADPMQDYGSRSKISASFFMSSTQLDGLVSGVGDVFKSWFSDGQYVFFLTAGAGDSNVYLSAVEITDWSTGAWQQVDVSSDANLYQTFTFSSGSASTSLTDAAGLVFAPDPNSPSQDLLYISNGAARIFVLEPLTVAVPEPATLGLLALGGIGLAASRRRRRSA